MPSVNKDSFVSSFSTLDHLFPFLIALARTSSTTLKTSGEKGSITLFLKFILFIFWPHHAACRIIVPRPGIEPVPLQWKR